MGLMGRGGGGEGNKQQGGAVGEEGAGREVGWVGQGGLLTVGVGWGMLEKGADKEGNQVERKRVKNDEGWAKIFFRFSMVH